MTRIIPIVALVIGSFFIPAALMAQTPIKRWGKPEEIAALALYICSDAAAFMTGNDVLIDGGWCAQ